MSTSTLESMALELFEQEYEREARRGAGQRVRRTPMGHVEVCPVAWVMNELLKLIEERHAEPVEELRPAIRRLIMEKAFAFGAQVAVADPTRAVDQEVELIIRTLERVREHAFASGRWSQMHCMPEMFVG